MQVAEFLSGMSGTGMCTLRSQAARTENLFKAPLKEGGSSSQTPDSD